ncbi:hypothetical protein AB838_06140 [Rhodobacteraceae bacterium (ex Bugula neritina AB1)]|nr:hypothetical protein AB838_06140 [Rhodobacteraceae bacterium (ex Bugula neritina AB1)]
MCLTVEWPAARNWAAVIARGRHQAQLFRRSAPVKTECETWELTGAARAPSAPDAKRPGRMQLYW